MSELDVKQWLEQASRTLERAQKLCTSAQKSLETTSRDLTINLADEISYANHMIESLKWQQQVAHVIYETLQRKVDRLIKNWKTQDSNQLQPALKSLDDILHKLSVTQVPLYLVDTETQDDLKILQDFISLPAINTLKQNISIYHANCEKLFTLLQDQFKSTIADQYQTLTRKYSRSLKSFNDLAPMHLVRKASNNTSPFEISNFIQTILKENSSLENELVNILEMLTNHYDQCSDGLQLVKQGKSTEIDLQVLSNDSLELPDVLKELTTIYEIIFNNESRAQKFLQSSISSIEACIASIKEQLSSYRVFKSSKVFQFMLLLYMVENSINRGSIEDGAGDFPIKTYSDTLNQLVYHYSQFFHVYKTKYLPELHHEQYKYPRKFFRLLNDFLNNELQSLQQEEAERRRKWLSAYGDFIPKEFKLPGEYNQPAVTSVITEGLDDIQKFFKDGTFSEDAEERKLIELMMQMKSLK